MSQRVRAGLRYPAALAMRREHASSQPTHASPPIWVGDDSALAEMVEVLRDADVIAVDTEGNSMHAYRERLCLLQVSALGQDWIVDTLAPLRAEWLAPLFADPRVVKILHDAEFDVLMLKRTWSFAIANIFDTKVAACSLGIEGVGLAAMLGRFFGIQLDKKLQRSDWGKRPLTREQLEYARCDTRWLEALAHELQDLLDERPEIHTLEVRAECRRLEAIEPPPRPSAEDGWRNLVGVARLDPRTRVVLAELWRLREAIAEERDVPPFKVLDPTLLVTLARARPRDEQELSAVEALPASLRFRYGHELLAAIARAGQRSPDEASRSRESHATDEVALSPRAERALLALRRWRKAEAEARGTDAALVLPKRVMQGLVTRSPLPRDVRDLEDSGLLEPWRLARYGAEIVAALRGE